MTSVGNIIASVTPFVILLLGLGLSMVTNRYISAWQKRLLFMFLFFTGTLIVQNAALYLLNNGKATWFLKTLCSVYGYAVRLGLTLLHGGEEKYCKKALNLAAEISKSQTLRLIDLLYCLPEDKVRMKELVCAED